MGDGLRERVRARAAALDCQRSQRAAQHHFNPLVILRLDDRSIRVSVSNHILAEHLPQLLLGRLQVGHIAPLHVKPRKDFLAVEMVGFGEHSGRLFHVTRVDEDVCQLIPHVGVGGAVLFLNRFLQNDLALVELADALQDPSQSGEVDGVVLNMR